MQKKAVIAGGHNESCEVAMDVIRMGGNAIDAAIATLCVMFVCEPAMASPGAGGFATVCMSDKQPEVFDFFCQTPQYKPPIGYCSYDKVVVDFGDDTEIFFAGNASTAVPGTIAGLFAMHQAYGTIPMKELFQPAIQKMKEGVVLNSFQNYDLTLLQQIFLAKPEGRAIFEKEGKIKEVGDKICMPELADFLDVLALEGQDLFYRGEAGQELIAIHQQDGGLLQAKDLHSYKVNRVPALASSIGDWVTWTVPNPYMGGRIYRLALQHMEDIGRKREYRLQEMVQVFHTISKVQKNESELTHLEKQKKLPLPNRRGATSHFSIIDTYGNAVSLTTSIGEGSGLFLPSSGIHLNNMLGELALLPNNLHSWRPNCRLNSMMCPLIMEHKEGDTFVFGTGGAGRIPYILALFTNDLLSAYPKVVLQDLLHLPRVYASSDTLHAEMPLHVSDYLGKVKHSKQWLNQSIYFGGINVVGLMNGTFMAAGDQRRDGYEKIIEA